MSDDWASQFRPGSLPDEQEEENASSESTIDTDKILLGFEAVIKRLDAMDARLGMYEAILSNPTWLPEHIDNLRKLHHLNAEAILQANQQFSTLLIRKLDEMEERLKSDEPSYTNVLYSDPELFHQISERTDEDEGVEVEKAMDAADALIDEIEGDSPIEVIESNVEESWPIVGRNEVPVEILEEYHSWKDKDREGSWQTFVRICGGPVKAKHFRELIEAYESL